MKKLLFSLAIPESIDLNSAKITKLINSIPDSFGVIHHSFQVKCHYIISIILIFSPRLSCNVSQLF